MSRAREALQVEKAHQGRKEIKDHLVLWGNKAHKAFKEFLELETFHYAHIRRFLFLPLFSIPILQQHLQEPALYFHQRYAAYLQKNLIFFNV